MLIMSADTEHNDIDRNIMIAKTASPGQTMSIFMTGRKTMTTTVLLAVTMIR